jgi:hypothetical protein
MDRNTAKSDLEIGKKAFENDTSERTSIYKREIELLNHRPRPVNVGSKMANPAFRYWAVLVKCSNHDGVKKEAVLGGLKENGKVIKSILLEERL